MSEAAGPLVRIERRGDVAILWMDDARRRNALSTALVREMLDAIAAGGRDGAGAFVLASDQKAFCAGADIRDMLDNGWLEADQNDLAVLTPPDLFKAIEAEPRPVIAAVNGPALGGGVELCLACDLAIAGPPASFMLPELGLGILPNTAIARLPALIGYRRAADLILTRRKVDAAEALALGLVTMLADDPVGQAVATAAALCASVPPVALAAAKRNLSRGRTWAEADGMLRQMDGREWREGVSAFLEKRTPDYGRYRKD
ncbi:MAG: enoyl-CoA hydratase/isomerase family protein [Rhizomicrobium sp.]